MKKFIASVFVILFFYSFIHAQSDGKGLRGNSLAIEDCKKMVEKMGGMEIWKEVRSLHFVHEWYPINRIDTYIENEILDLTAPRSWVERKSEVNHSFRAYSPEGKYWTINNGTFQFGNEAILTSSLQRAPFNFYHLIRAIAIDDPFYEVNYGDSDIPNTKQINFSGPDGVLRGWIILNVNKEPVVKATPEYRYTLGPLQRFGNLWAPAWGVYDTGYTRYEMISLKGDSSPPDSNLFIPPLQR